jgi:hypothetical protein
LTSGRAVNTGQLSVVAAQSTDSQVRIRNSTTRAAANQYGIRFADSSNETNAFIYAEQKSSGNNSSELVFGTNNGTGGALLTSGVELMRGIGTGDIKIVTGNISISTAAKGITTGSSISLGFGTNGSTTGMTLDTSNNLNVLGSYTANSVAVPTISSTSTLTNKRVTPRVSTTTSSATPTINTDNVDVYGLTAQAVDITSFSTNLSGTPTDGQLLRIYIVGTAARAITWGASFEASTTPLPTTTVTTNRLDVGFVWNAATSKWRCLASA